MLVFVNSNYTVNTSSDIIISDSLSKYYNQDVSVYHHENGTPYLVGISGNISITHSYSMLVFAISEQSLGIDIEKNIDRNFSRIADKMSFKNINNLDEFYHAWTAYEATYKAQGRYPTHHYDIVKGYTFAVASRDQQIDLIWL